MKKNINIKKILLDELNEWIEDDFIAETYEHEDYEDVIVYVAKNRNFLCVRKDEEGNIVDIWDY
jgi:hypothetical protein